MERNMLSKPIEELLSKLLKREIFSPSVQPPLVNKISATARQTLCFLGTENHRHLCQTLVKKFLYTFIILLQASGPSIL